MARTATPRIPWTGWTSPISTPPCGYRVPGHQPYTLTLPAGWRADPEVRQAVEARVDAAESA
jgi:hypothetical protein